MLYVFGQPQLTCPFPAGKLACRMRRDILVICVDGHLLESGLRLPICAGFVAEGLKSSDERFYRYF